MAASTAAFDAAYTAIPGPPTSDDIDDIDTMLNPGLKFPFLDASLTISKNEVTLVLNTSLVCCVFNKFIGLRERIPTQFT